MCLRGCEGRSKGGVGMSRSSGIWVLAFVCLVLVLAWSMMNVTDPAPVASNPTAAPWSVLGDSTFTFAYGGGYGRQWLACPHRAGAAPGRFGQSELLLGRGGSQLQHPGWERTELVQIRELEFEETRTVSVRTPIGESRE